MTMTDKTSTAPVMSLRDTYERLRALYGGSQACLDTHMTDDVLGPMIDSITPYLNAPTPDVVGGDVVAWMHPTIITFKDCVKTSCPPEMQPDLDGTVAWHPEIYADNYEVVDKYGVKHSPYPLCRATPRVKGDADVERALQWLHVLVTSSHNHDWKRNREEWAVIRKALAAPRVQGYAVTSSVRDVLREMRNEVEDLPQRHEVLQHYIDRLDAALAAQPKGYVELSTMLRGRALFLRERGEVKSPELMELAANYIDGNPAAQQSGDEAVGSWPWLRGVLSGMPSREEPIGGQRHRYLNRDEVLAWIDEGERRATLSHPAEQTRGDGVEVWMIRRNDGEVYWDETGCVFHDEASASQEARLMTDSDPDGYAFGAFALRSIAPRQAVPDGWQPIETAPTDGTKHVRGLHVYSSSDGAFLYWDAVAGYVGEEDGMFYSTEGDVSGWDAQDYTHWFPLPVEPKAAAPSAGRMGVGRG